MIIFIFLQSNEVVFLKSAFDCARTMICRTMFRESTEPIQIVNINASKVVNNEPLVAEAPSVDLMTELENFENLLVTPEEALPEDAQEVKLSYAIKVALHVIQRYNEAQSGLGDGKPKRGGRKKVPPPTKVVIFTTLQNAEISENAVTKLIDSFKEHSISLYLMTPPEKCIFTLKENSTFDDVTKAMENPMLLPFELVDLQRLIIESKGLICNVNFGASLFEVHKAKKLPQAWSVNLRIGSKIYIPLQGYRKSIDFVLPSWKYTKREAPATEKSTEDGAPEVLEDEQNSKKIKMEKEENGQTQETGVVLDVHRAAGGPVYLTKEEKSAHKPITEKCLDLLFTISQDEINQIHCAASPVRYLFPKNEAVSPQYDALRQALIKNKTAGIARYCYYKNVHPKLVALLPHENAIQMFQVPYKDYISDPLTFIQTKKGLWTDPLNQELKEDQSTILEAQKKKLNPELKDAVDQVLSEMTIQDDDCTTMLPVQFKYNPVLDFYHETIVGRALKTDSEISVDALSLQNPRFTRTTDAFQNLTEIW